MDTTEPFKKLRWTQLRGARGVGAGSAAPALAGVYAYATVSSTHGLPHRHDWLYIGKAKDLGARLKSHDPFYESNPALADWLATHKSSAQVWYSPVDPANLDRIEQELIRTIVPKFNRNLYGGVR